MACLKWQLAELLASWRPSLVAFNVLLKRCEWRRASSWLALRPVTPDLVSYCTLMSTSRWPRGLEVLQRSKGLLLQPNLVMQNAALSFQQNWRLPLELMRLMKEMDDFTVNTAPRLI